MKYIIMEAEMGDGMKVEMPIAFPNNIVHKDMADCVMLAIWESTGFRAKPIAAGELSMFGLEAACHGYSESLDLQSRDDVDTTLFKMVDYGGGIKG